MLASAIVLVTAVATAAVLAFTPRIRSSRAWRATVTPLSSIMGSGFLVCAPLLAGEAGLFAPVAMAVLLLVAFAVGSMIRFNIRYAEPELEDDDEPGEHRLHRGHRQCSRSHWSRLAQRVAAPVERASVEFGDPVARVRFVILNFFGQTACGELARFFFREMNWKQVAGQQGRSHAAVRKQWERCVSLLREAVRTDPTLAALSDWAAAEGGDS